MHFRVQADLGGIVVGDRRLGQARLGMRVSHTTIVRRVRRVARGQPTGQRACSAPSAKAPIGADGVFQRTRDELTWPFGSGGIRSESGVIFSFSAAYLRMFRPQMSHFKPPRRVAGRGGTHILELSQPAYILRLALCVPSAL